MTSDDRDQLLRRIGLDAAPPCTAEGLRAVHRAYVTAIPYEDLAIQLDEPRALDLDLVLARVLRGGRGGYCFEVNGLLAQLLRDLGFAVEHRLGVVGAHGDRAPVNHCALVATVPADGSSFVVEAGYGEGWLDPLPLVPGEHAGPGGLSWAVAREQDGWWWIGQHRWGSTGGIAVSPEPVGFDAFAEPHRERAYDPSSPFVQTLVVQRPFDDRIVTLRARTLTVRGPSVDTSRLVGSADELGDVLHDAFGIDPAPLDRERLWRQACAQHEAWLATKEG